MVFLKSVFTCVPFQAKHFHNSCIAKVSPHCVFSSVLLDILSKKNICHTGCIYTVSPQYVFFGDVIELSEHIITTLVALIRFLSIKHFYLTLLNRNLLRIIWTYFWHLGVCPSSYTYTTTIYYPFNLCIKHWNSLKISNHMVGT